MLELIYTPDGYCTQDSKTMEYALGLVDNANEPNNMYQVRFGQAMILDAVRVLIKRGVIDHSLVVIRYKDNAMYVGKKGHLSDWPRGFCDHTEDYLMELLG